MCHCPRLPASMRPCQHCRDSADRARLERIAAAAVVETAEVWTLPPPVRHHTLIRQWVVSNDVSAVGRLQQGFVTTRGRYVDRYEAARLAYASRQIPYRCRMLFTEDLW